MKTIDTFYKAYYKIDGFYHTNMLDVIDYDNPEDVKLLNEALLKILSDGEILFVVDDNTEVDVSAFILYRKGDKILNEFILFEQGEFSYCAEFCSWQFPEEFALNDEEKRGFIRRLKNLIAFDNLNLVIKNYTYTEKDINRNQELIDITPSQIATIKVMAFFWRYIYVFVMFASVLVLRYSNEKPVSTIILGCFILVYCLYFFIGIRLGFKHVYYAIQKNSRREIDYNNTTFSKESIKTP